MTTKTLPFNTFGELEKAILAVLPEAGVCQDEEGHLVINTYLFVSPMGCLTPDLPLSLKRVRGKRTLRLPPDYKEAEIQDHLVLGNVMDTLESLPMERECLLGFEHAHSYRGYYEDLAFVRSTKTRAISELCSDLRRACGGRFYGWKGGEYQMDRECWVWIAEVGCEGAPLTRKLLAEMLGIQKSEVIMRPEE